MNEEETINEILNSLRDGYFSKSLLKASDFVVKIPMQNSFNSLNVSNALSAIIFETLRQKLTNK